MLIFFRKIFIVTVLIFSFSFVCYSLEESDISASSAVLIDGATNEIIFEKNARKIRSMASTTKIMTSLLAVESGRLSEIVTVKEKPYIEGTAVGLKKGDKLTLETLCFAMMLESGNDAAIVTADFLAGSEEEFSKLMNIKASDLGMNDTNFVTASGLDDSEHYTTAYDMAILGAYAIKNDMFRKIAGTKNYKAKLISPDAIRYFSNHNRLLRECEGVIGIKTGFTKKSGRCLVSACNRNGKTLVCVTLNAPDDWNDHKKLYDYGFSLYGEYCKTIDLPLSLSVFGSEKCSIKINASDNKSTFVLKDSDIYTKVYIDNMIYAPVKKGDAVGKIKIFQNKLPVCEYSIVAVEDADISADSIIYKPSFLRRVSDYIKKLI